MSPIPVAGEDKETLILAITSGLTSNRFPDAGLKENFRSASSKSERSNVTCGWMVEKSSKALLII